MLQARVAREEMLEGERRLSAILVEFENAYIIFLSEGGDRLGTLAISIPPRGGMIGPALSSILFGDRNAVIARVLAERIAYKSGKISLVSIFLRTIDGRESGSTLLKLIDKVMQKGREKDES